MVAGSTPAFFSKSFYILIIISMVQVERVNPDTWAVELVEVSEQEAAAAAAEETTQDDQTGVDTNAGNQPDESLTATTTNYADMELPALIDLAISRGLSVEPDATKEAVIASLEEADKLKVEGTVE